MVMIEGYFDESGDFEQGEKVFCISGYFITSEAAEAMDQEWGLVLDDHRIPYFHMVDCAHGNGVFSGKSNEERSEIVIKLISLIKKYTIEGFSIVAKEELFEIGDGDEDIYSHCVSGCLYALQAFLDTARINGGLAYFFETGHKNRGRAYNHVADQLQKLSAPLTFAKKEQVRLLQAADILAWQTTKYVKDRFHGIRPPRKDFLSLMEHSHSFAYIDKRDGKKSMGIELWPLSKRSQTTVSLSINTDGLITYFTQYGEDIPIVMVSRTFGYRMGGGRLAYVQFEDMTKKKFYLAFDQRRLLEAVLHSSHAMSLYPETETAITMPAESFTIQSKDGEKFLLVQIKEGPRFAYRLSEDMIQHLRAVITNE